jgi:Family of unknown function (DUF5675)
MTNVTITRNRELNLKTIVSGTFFINGTYVCDTLEDVERLKWNLVNGVKKLLGLKIYGQTAIPTGNYIATYIKHAKFGKCLFIVGNQVPQFAGIIIGHSGNTKDDTLGCVIVGKINTKLEVITGGTSRPAMEKIRTELEKTGVNIGDKVSITIR